MQDVPTLLSPPGNFVNDVISPMLAWRRQGLKAVLVTLIGVEGASPRPVGSQMVVNEAGEWIGQISSDCAEAAIAAEALLCLEATRARVVRYGRGSKYMDVRLPCGSGLDVHFDPNVPIEILQQLVEAQKERVPVGFVSPLCGEGKGSDAYRVVTTPDVSVGEARVLSVSQHSFERCYLPETQLMIAGRGPYAAAMVDIAGPLGWEVNLWTPDLSLSDRYVGKCGSVRRITRPTDLGTEGIDRWTATVLLFHDHEWEPDILARVLKCDGFYVGALGSRNTHARRLEGLVQLGVDANLVEKISGPVGLDIGAQTPPEIALSIASEIIAARRNKTWPKRN